MQLLFFCPRWGHAQLTWDELARRARESGYDGIETDVPESPREADALQESLARHDLKMVAQHWETMEPGFDEHARAYENRLRHLASANPWCINSHTGRDFFSPGENEALLEIARQVSEQYNIPVYHETHRGRFSFAAHATLPFLRKYPWLRLTWDVSHWIVVAETFLQDQPEAIAAAIAHTGHLHARIGHTQGSQAPDPFGAAWQEALAAHLLYWDRVIDMAEANERTAFGITPEFGPAPYMPMHPDTGKPVRDQWELNAAMMRLLKKRYDTNE